MIEQFTVILNLFQDLISGRLENQPSPQPSPIGEGAICHSEGCQASLEGKKIRRYEGKLFSVNSLSSNPPTLLSSNNHSGGNASLIPPYALKQRAEFTFAEGATHVDTTDNVRKAAFTLAEVLITLGIIGVVAALTIPTLIANYKEKEIITKAKKDYSLVMQAFKLAQAEAGIPGDNSVVYTDASSSNDVAKALSKYITGGHLCLSNSNEQMCKDLNYRILYSTYENQYGTVNAPAIILPDNGVVFLTLSQKCVDTHVEIWHRDENGNPAYNDDGTPKIISDVRNACGDIIIDVNGSRQPNKYGYDAFAVTVWSDRIDKGQWNVYGADSLFSIMTGGKLKYNTNK